MKPLLIIASLGILLAFAVYQVRIALKTIKDEQKQIDNDKDGE